MTQVPPQQPSPSQPLPYAPPVKKGKGMAIAALILGILAVIPCLGMATGLTAIILGIIVLATGREGKGKAIAAIVLSAVLSIVAWLLWLGAAFYARQQTNVWVEQTWDEIRQTTDEHPLEQPPTEPAEDEPGE